MEADGRRWERKRSQKKKQISVFPPSASSNKTDETDAFHCVKDIFKFHRHIKPTIQCFHYTATTEDSFLASAEPNFNQGNKSRPANQPKPIFVLNESIPDQQRDSCVLMRFQTRQKQHVLTPNSSKMEI